MTWQVKRMPSRSRSRGVKRARRSSSVMSRSIALGREKGRGKRKYRGAHMPSLNTHSYSRYALNPEMISCTGATEVGSIQFTLDEVAGHAEFVAMYDQYKISKVVMKVQLVNNPDHIEILNSSSVTNSSNWFPKFWYIRDYDGGGSDTIAQLKERQGAKFFILKPNMVKRIAIKPMVTVQTYRTATTTGYSPKKLFIDMANGTDVPHYGLNYVVDMLGQNPVDTAPYVIRIEYQYFFTCKGAR